MTDPYLMLGVSPTATQSEIAHAYRRKLRTHHPDARPGAPSSAADERLRQILAAYALLRDPRRRAEYDRTVVQVRNSGTPRDNTGPVRIKVKRTGPTVDPPPLRAGPVRRHR